LPSVFTRTYGGCDHATGQASFEAETQTTQSRLREGEGAAGLGLSLVSSASASTMPTAGIPQSDNTSPNQRFVLGEEEMGDVSLATFYLFDKENAGSGVQLARGCGGCGGCRGCGGRFGDCGFVGCVGCVGCVACAACAGCCLSWGACRLC